MFAYVNHQLSWWKTFYFQSFFSPFLYYEKMSKFQLLVFCCGCCWFLIVDSCTRMKMIWSYWCVIEKREDASTSCFFFRFFSIDFMAQEQILKQQTNLHNFITIFVLFFTRSFVYFAFTCVENITVMNSGPFGKAGEPVHFGETYEIYWARHVCDGGYDE